MLEQTMGRGLISRPARTMVAVGLATVVCIGGCGGGSGGKSSASPSTPSQPGSSSQPGSTSPAGSATPTGSVPIAPLKQSKFYFMTKLSQTQLCGLLHGGEPSAILRSPAGAASYINTFGLGVVCTWAKSGSSGELYIGISTIFNWRAAQPIDKLAGDKPTTVDGHPADSGAPNNTIPYAAVHVAVAGLNDPTVEFRAPTLAEALRLAQTVMPRLLAITG